MNSEERRLTSEYTATTQFYTWSVAELSRQIGSVPEDEYRKLFQVVKDARTECEIARRALYRFMYG
jgi:hypothetical protein